MTNGRLRPDLEVQTSRAIRDDRYVYARVFRGRRGSEVQVAGFNTRLAPTTGSGANRDQHAIAGETAPMTSVLSAPGGIAILKGDEIWIGEARYRVIAVDPHPGATQVIVQSTQ